MEYIAGKTDFKLKNSAVTLGKFDGFHRGHQLLMDQVLAYQEQGYTAVMFSFLVHPGSFLAGKNFELIYTEEEKVNRLKRSGMDVLVSYPFTEETRSIEPEDFIKDVLVGKLDAKIIVVGDDFRFGHNRRGDIHMLREFESVYGYKLVSSEKKRLHDNIISSSEIRKGLSSGDMEAVNEMLGQPFSILGNVLHGRKIGRTLGMPTTNILPPKNKLLPPCGVYATTTLIDGVRYKGVTNIGYKPTVGEEKEKGVETFLLDFDQDLYGQTIEVELLHYQRPELKFSSLEELKLEMEQDIRIARDYFKSLEASASE